MTTYPHPHGHRIHLHRPHINPWLVAVIGLGAGLLALGSWVLVDRYAGGSTPEQSATTLIDNYNAAINAHDWNAAAAFFTRDAVYYDGSNRLVGRNNIRLAMQSIPYPDYQATRIAPVIVARDEAGHEFATTFANEEPVISGLIPQVYQLKDGKILREWEFVFGTAPFAGAVLR